MRLCITASSNCRNASFIPESFDAIMKNGDKVWIDTTGNICFSEGLGAEVNGNLYVCNNPLTKDETIALLCDIQEIEKFYVSVFEEKLPMDISEIQFKNVEMFISTYTNCFKFKDFVIEIC